MKGRAHRTRVAHGLLTRLLVAGAGFAVAAQASAEPLPAGTGAAGPEDPPGIMIYVDPKTGAILKEPAPGTVPLQLTPKLQNALSTSDQGLVETPSPVPGGGVMIDLQGRFQSPLFVTIDDNGNVRIRHLHETPEPGETK